MKNYIRNASVGTFALLLLLGGFAYSTPTAEAKSSNANQMTVNISGNNGLHLGWYKNGKINNYCFGDCNNDFNDLLAMFRLRLQAFRSGNYNYNYNYNYGYNSDISIFTRMPDDIDEDSATLQGKVVLDDDEEVEVYFIWGDSSNNLDEETGHITIDENDSGLFEKSISDLDEDTRYYYQAAVEDEDGDVMYGAMYSFVTDGDGGNSNSDVDVYTRSASSIDEDSAKLRGEVDLNGDDEAEVYFIWGESRYDLDEETGHSTIDDNDDEEFEKTISGLDDDTRYYYRAVAEDEDGDEVYGTIYSFVTDSGDSNDDEYPDVTTRSASNITDDSADFTGTVDMNDFRNGEVFFVYGTDEDQVKDVEDDYDTYAEVDDHEDGDDFQAIRVDKDLDGKGTYEAELDGLDDDTRYYYSICVGFEDEDGDDTILCGSTKYFTTDEN